ncbi:MAG: MBL fold metallo-hydrolase [Pseudomonadota bacterium]
MSAPAPAKYKIKHPCILPTERPKTRYGESPFYEEGLYDLGNQIYAWLVPNGSWGEANAGLIVGQQRSLLVDTLWDLKYTSEMLDAMQNLTIMAPIEIVVNTHADGDHFWGNQLLHQARRITSAAALKEMSHHHPRQMRLFHSLGRIFSLLPFRNARNVGHWFRQMGAPYDFTDIIFTPAKESFKKRMSVVLDNRRIELMDVGPAHTLGDVMVYIPDSKVLFASDILFINSTPVMWAGPVANWIRVLDQILAMDVETIVPGHGPITQKNGVQLVKDYWIYVSREAHRRFAVGMGPKKVAFDIALSQDFSRQVFAEWDSPERLMTNCYVLYRHYKRGAKSRALKPLKPLQIVNIMRHQAALAHSLKEARPQVMRRKIENS